MCTFCLSTTYFQLGQGVLHDAVRRLHQRRDDRLLHEVQHLRLGGEARREQRHLLLPAPAAQVDRHLPDLRYAGPGWLVGRP